MSTPDRNEIAPRPWTLSEGTIFDANGARVAYVAVRWHPAISGDYGRECELIAGKLTAAADLYEALTELESYVVSVLTGPIMSAAGVRWPDGKPNGPVLQKARAALAAAAPAGQVKAANYVQIGGTDYLCVDIFNCGCSPGPDCARCERVPSERF